MKLRALLDGATLLGYVGLRSAAVRMPVRTVPERLASLPRRGLPLRRPVHVYWDEHQIPYIDAEDDADLAVALGVVHAHLRLAQMELLRRVATGRLAEAIGGVALAADEALRILDFGRAVPAIEAALPADTRRWLGGFVAGINYYVANAAERPVEAALLGLAGETWRIADVLTIGRLAAADVTWLVWMRLLRLRRRRDWPQIWERLRRSLVPGTGDESDLHGIDEALPIGATPSGSNAFAVAARRSATGAAWLAGDPHLSLTLPNLWFAAGCRSPSYHAVGLMVPGIPAIAVGRNPWIAWGGTNLHAAASELCDVATLPPSAIEEHRQTIPVRWSSRRKLRVRRTEFGAIVSDAGLVGAPPRELLALRWIGHLPSDEITALLAVGRARDWPGFRAALGTFAVPGQNFIFADVFGRVGWTVGAWLPRHMTNGTGFVVAPDDAAGWGRLIRMPELPAVFEPPEGYIASANNRPPVATETPVGFFFPGDERLDRLKQLLEASGRIDWAAITRIQEDVLGANSRALRDRLLELIRRIPVPTRSAKEGTLLAALAAWDGTYASDSAGALAHELMLCHTIRQVYGSDAEQVYFAGWDPLRMMREDLTKLEPQAAAAPLRRALRAAAHGFARYRIWGAMHRLRLRHFLCALPPLRHRVPEFDMPTAGSRDTLFKMAQGLVGTRHAASYGSNARYIFDMSHPDGNRLVLLGGQDGWLGSTTATDQVGLWRRGDYVTLPLRLEAVQARFPYRTELAP